MEIASASVNKSLQKPGKGSIGERIGEYTPSVNRLLVDLKKLDHYDDPFAALDRLRSTLEECSQKQKMESVLKL